jgi:hypothetical protein
MQGSTTSPFQSSTNTREPAMDSGRRGQHMNPSSEKLSQTDRPENLPIPAVSRTPLALSGND